MKVLLLLILWNPDGTVNNARIDSDFTYKTNAECAEVAKDMHRIWMEKPDKRKLTALCIGPLNGKEEDVGVAI